jgi:hypothetical protein
MIFLVGIRHHELQTEAAQARLVREARGDEPPLHTAIATASRRLGATLDRVAQQLEIIRSTPAMPRRTHSRADGAFPA